MITIVLVLIVFKLKSWGHLCPRSRQDWVKMHYFHFKMKPRLITSTTTLICSAVSVGRLWLRKIHKSQCWWFNPQLLLSTCENVLQQVTTTDSQASTSWEYFGYSKTIYTLPLPCTPYLQVLKLEKYRDEVRFHFCLPSLCDCGPEGIICFSNDLCDYECFKGPDSDLMTELEGSRAKEMRVIRGRGEAAAQDRRKEIALGPSLRALTDKHPHTSFQ